MGATLEATLDQSVITETDNEFLLEALKAPVFIDLVDFEGIPEDRGRAGQEFYALEALPIVTSALPETSDIAARALADSKITCTWAEYGDRVQLTALARFKSKPNVRKDAATLAAKQMGESVDTIIRNAVLGGAFTYMPSNLSARTDLDATSDLITYARICEQVGMARAMGIVPFEGDTFAAIVHPYVITTIQGLTEFKESAVYRGGDPEKKKVFRHEAFEWAGVRWIPSRLGKLYLSGGTVAQAATTISAAVSAGGTAVSFTSDTGLAAGNWLTIGTLEAGDAEQVQITVNGASPQTIRGAGNAVGNMGFKYDHAILSAATEAANVAAIPLVGKGSVRGLYVEEVGKTGQLVIRTDLDSLNRFVSIGWKWYGGAAIFPKKILRGEYAIAQQLLGNQM